MDSSENSPISFRSGFYCLATIARFHQISADPNHLDHHFGQNDTPIGEVHIIRAANYLKLKAKAYKSNWSSLTKLAMPAIAKTKDDRFILLARVLGDKVLIQNPQNPKPQTLSRDEFEQIWSGRLILITRRSILPGEKGRFDISWFIPSILKHKNLLIQVLVASFFIQLFALITPLFFQVIIDKVLVHRGISTLDVLCFGLIVISLFDVILNGLRTYVFSHTTNRIDVALGAKLFKHLMHLPISFFNTRRVGDTVARVRELETIRNFITGSALTLIIDLLFTLVFFVVMYFFSPLLTFVVLGSIPFYIALSLIITPILRSRLNEKFKRGAENQSFLVESVSGVETLKSIAVEPQIQHRWEEQLAAYVSASFNSNVIGNVSSQIASLINKTVTILILWFGATLVMVGSLSIGQLIAFNMIAGRVSSPLLRLVQLWQDFQQARISVERLGDILNLPKEHCQNSSHSILPKLTGYVRLEHVRFRYQTGSPEVLKDFSLDVKAGEVIGIVGRSGSGKSTLTKLIQRLYVPEEGRVLVDGYDLAQIDPAWLRRQVGVVLQENLLFNRSVKDNIALVDPGLPLDRVIEVAKLSGAHEFILKLPEGYDTIVGEHGASLSGGQRQRIAIARALINNPRILIFDEATSALDYESERIIQDNMRAICKHRTVFIIAHRLSTVKMADRIVVIDHGRLVESGCHEVLLAQGGYYSKLYSHQNHASSSRSLNYSTLQHNATKILSSKTEGGIA